MGAGYIQLIFFRIFALLFSASCRGSSGMDTGYIKDECNTQEVCALEACAPLKSRPPVALTRTNAAKVGTLHLSRSVILNSSSFATLRISAEDSRRAHAF